MSSPFEDAAVSRWRLFLELRDALRQALCPALPLVHLLRFGRRIACRLRVRRPARPLQMQKLMPLVMRL